MVKQRRLEGKKRDRVGERNDVQNIYRLYTAVPVDMRRANVSCSVPLYLHSSTGLRVRLQPVDSGWTLRRDFMPKYCICQTAGE